MRSLLRYRPYHVLILATTASFHTSRVAASFSTAAASLSSRRDHRESFPGRRRRRVVVVVLAARGTTASSSSTGDPWRPGTEPLLLLDPSALSTMGDGGGRPRLPRDEAYASAVLRAWRDEVAARRDGRDGGASVDGDDDEGRTTSSVSAPLVYGCATDGTSLHGHIYRRCPPSSSSPSSPPITNKNDPPPSPPPPLLPGILLFHTGAGPQDVFLRWKADSLVNEVGTFGDGGCVVLIADVLGDASGWAWHDRARYDDVRRDLLVPNGDGRRDALRERVRAAIDALSSQPGVDARRIGAMGFCLGGHPVLELARMRMTLDSRVRVMVTFHGVFDGVRELEPIATLEGGGVDDGCDVLVCTGEDDPYVSSEDLDAAMRMFDDLGCRCRVMKFEGTRHGFTNPAQDYNPNRDAFAYNEAACNGAWSAALSLLKDMA
jgi:dienelactone hydrolase